MSLTIEKCLQAWANSLRQLNAKADIVFFGDSLIYYGEFSSIFPDKTVCNLGLRGDTIKGMIDRVELVIMLNPKKIYLMAGINDVANNSEEQFRVRYDELVQRLKKYLPSSEIAVFSILPVNDSAFSIGCNNIQICKCNSQIKRIAIEYGVYYIDLFSVYEENGMMPNTLTIDGIHLSNDGYYKWYNELTK